MGKRTVARNISLGPAGGVPKRFGRCESCGQMKKRSWHRDPDGTLRLFCDMCNRRYAPSC